MDQNQKIGSLKAIQNKITRATANRAGATELVLNALSSGKLNNFDSILRKATFAKGRDGYNTMKSEGKIPVCPIKGSTCSNTHYIFSTKQGKEIAVSESCGKVIVDFVSGKLTEKQLTGDKQKKAA